MMLGYFSLYSLEIEERNRKRRGVSSQSSFIVGSGGCMDVCVRETEKGREGEEGKREYYTAKQNFCSLIMLLIFSMTIFELPAVSRNSRNLKMETV